KNQLLDFPDFQPVHQLIAETAEKLGGETAIYFQDQRITYRELNETANQLAHYFIQTGLNTGDIVGILLDRSIEMVIAILATLKAGGVYLPIDTEYPAGRVNYFLDDSSVKFVITQEKNKVNFADDIPLIIYEKFAIKKANYPISN